MATVRQYAVMAAVVIASLLLMKVLVNRVHEQSPPQPTTAPVVDGSSKDIWDILNSISGLISGVVIAGLGVYLGHIYQDRQRDQEREHKRQEFRASMVQAFTPYILSSDSRQVARAFEIMTVLDEGLATALSIRILASDATTPEQRQRAREILAGRMREVAAEQAGLSGEELDRFVEEHLRRVINA